VFSLQPAFPRTFQLHVWKLTANNRLFLVNQLWHRLKPCSCVLLRDNGADGMAASWLVMHGCIMVGHAWLHHGWSCMAASWLVMHACIMVGHAMCIEGQNINNNYRSQLPVTYGIVLTVTPTTYYSWRDKSNDFSNWPSSQPTTVTSVVLVKTQSLGGRNSLSLKRMNKMLETPQKVWKSCLQFFWAALLVLLLRWT